MKLTQGELGALIVRSVENHVAGWAREIGLEGASEQFRDDVVEAILSCVEMLEVGNDIEEHLSRVEEEAWAARDHLMRLYEALLALTPRFRKSLEDYNGSGNLEFHLIPSRALWISVLINRLPEFNSPRRLKGLSRQIIFDKGGPRRLTAFRELVTGLRQAFKAGTGLDAKGTPPDHFLKLVEAVLPKIAPIAELSLDRSLPLKWHPTDAPARQKYIYEMIRTPQAEPDGVLLRR
jgi:hypothetical protein